MLSSKYFLRLSLLRQPLSQLPDENGVIKQRITEGKKMPEISQTKLKGFSYLRQIERSKTTVYTFLLLFCLGILIF